MRLIVLGSGISTHTPGTAFRFPAAHLIEAGGEKILFDAGIGVLPQLARLNISLTDIKTICITHYHADHFVLEPILQTSYLLSRSQGKQNLRIFGPSDIEAKVRTGCQTKGWSFDDDIAPGVGITFRPYKDKQPFKLADNLQLTAYQTQHYQLEAYILRLDDDSGSLVYSGDTAPSLELSQASANTNLLLCESAVNLGSQSDEGHTNVEDAAKIAMNQSVKHLVFTHYSGSNNTEEMVTVAKASGYKGKVSVAQDLDKFEL